ncbi:MAG: hypothetical protein Q8891_17860 [Bacteroidota bacterium]|nr:hypothetical protein [Bacteroidota bacterium]
MKKIQIWLFALILFYFKNFTFFINKNAAWEYKAQQMMEALMNFLLEGNMRLFY